MWGSRSAGRRRAGRRGRRCRWPRRDARRGRPRSTGGSRKAARPIGAISPVSTSTRAAGEQPKSATIAVANSVNGRQQRRPLEVEVHHQRHGLGQRPQPGDQPRPVRQRSLVEEAFEEQIVARLERGGHPDHGHVSVRWIFDHLAQPRRLLGGEFLDVHLQAVARQGQAPAGRPPPRSAAAPVDSAWARCPAARKASEPTIRSASSSSTNGSSNRPELELHDQQSPGRLVDPLLADAFLSDRLQQQLGARLAAELVGTGVDDLDHAVQPAEVLGAPAPGRGRLAEHDSVGDQSPVGADHPVVAQPLPQQPGEDLPVEAEPDLLDRPRRRAPARSASRSRASAQRCRPRSPGGTGSGDTRTARRGRPARGRTGSAGPHRPAAVRRRESAWPWWPRSPDRARGGAGTRRCTPPRPRPRSRRHCRSCGTAVPSAAR